jgi:hypothetical protein
VNPNLKARKQKKTNRYSFKDVKTQRWSFGKIPNYAVAGNE